MAGGYSQRYVLARLVYGANLGLMWALQLFPPATHHSVGYPTQPLFLPPPLPIRRPEQGEAAPLPAAVYCTCVFMLQLIKAPSKAITGYGVYK